ncbi:probable C-terminal domain small phosphatase [Abrus precatorius]|uniref:Probable C-terminal domain small phosphatase n=1 Tax=Abrus precatorius TaxID=3816 RepID=A0A8B8K501_ABRPR|nr:probable C-terminal domain small phosphatase [Abrus precatorius]
MVSKVKRAPIKSIKNRRWRRKTPIKNVVAASSAVLASIHRRITKLFSKLARLSTTHKKTSYKILKKTASDFYSQQEQQSLDAIRRTLVFDNVNDPPLLPPSLSPRRTVFLDLDETLIHSKASPPPEHFDFVVRPVIDGEVMDFYVLKRPGVDEFLESLAKKFEVVVFTAALKEYASMVLDRLDRNRFISHRLYRDSCRNVDGKFVKDLSEMGRDLKRVVIVDDNPNSYANQPDNAIPIRPFVDDLCDRELWKLRHFFNGSDCYDDMRDAVKHYVTVQQQFSYDHCFPSIGCQLVTNSGHPVSLYFVSGLLCSSLPPSFRKSLDRPICHVSQTHFIYVPAAVSIGSPVQTPSLIKVKA